MITDEETRDIEDGVAERQKTCFEAIVDVETKYTQKTRNCDFMVTNMIGRRTHHPVSSISSDYPSHGDIGFSHAALKLGDDMSRSL